jgi:ABC-2 type transport system ATP-binding protein
MDRVETLADRVTVLAQSELVTMGTPTSVGERDTGMVTIRFELPPGVEAADLPITVDSREGRHVEIQTDDELRVLHTLTGWALERGVALPGLAVLRVTLEDVYLRLTKERQ